MGVKLSIDCCSCLNSRAETEEGEFTGPKYEIRQKSKENLSIFNQQYMRPSMTGSDSLSYFEHQDYSTENKTTHKSGSLDPAGVPEMVSPKNSVNYLKKPEKKERSISFSGKNPFAESYRVIAAAKRKSIDPKINIIITNC